MRHKRKIEPVRALVKERKADIDQTDKHPQILRIGEPDGEEESACEETVAVQQDLLRPDALGSSVCQVCNKAAQRSEHDVQEAEHCGPIAGALEREGRDVLVEEVAQDAVHGKFSPK